MGKKSRILSLAVAVVLVIGCMTGCNNGAQGNERNEPGATDNTTKDVEIAVWNSGNGVEWLTAMIDGFKKKHPEYNVFYRASANEGTTVATFGMPDIDTVDMYMTIKNDLQTYTEYLEPLDDVLEATAEGDLKPIKDKFKPDYLATAQWSDGHYYSMGSGGGVLSFAYNKELFKKAGITQLPRTTDELIVTCDTLKSQGITPLCHFQWGGYYIYLFHAFMAQYDGTEYLVNSFYGCTDENGISPSKEVFTKKDGRYYALKAFEKFVTPEYTLTGSNSKSHTEIQTEFLNDKAAMMYNGAWMVNEMKSIGSGDKIGVMRTPVLSAIVDKLTTVKTESQLRKVITAIDEVTSGEKQLSDFASGDGYMVGDTVVSSEDWKTVSAARHAVANNFNGELAFIPNYSQAKDGAKEFLKYMYSDEGYQIYVNALHSPRPMLMSTGEKIDVSSFSDFEKSQFQLMDEGESFVSPHISSKHEIFVTGGADYLAKISYIDKMSAQNMSDRMGADAIWQLYLDTVNDNYEKIWLKNMK